MESIIFSIMNMNALMKLEEENAHINDDNEREIRSKLIEAIMDKIADYDVHVRKYQYDKYLKELMTRGIKFIPVDRKEVVSQWDMLYDSLVSDQTRKNTKCYNDQFKWHLFSFDLLPTKKKSAAQIAFDSQEKGTLYWFFENSKEAYLVINAHLLKASDFEVLCEYSTLNIADMYVFDPSRKWTYVKTHEDSCGPYFFIDE